MIINVQFDTTVVSDAAALGRLFGNQEDAKFVPAPTAEAPVSAPQAAAPAPKAPAKPKATPKPTPAAEPVVEEDLVGEEVDYVALRKQAVDRATALVSNKRSAEVKSALVALGAELGTELKRVGDVPNESLQAFLEAVAEEESVV